MKLPTSNTSLKQPADKEALAHCRRCYEVKCNPEEFSDNYGEKLDRRDACLDKDASLVIKITDTCPCKYAANAFSNKRWCVDRSAALFLLLWRSAFEF